MLTSPPGSLRGATSPRVELAPPYADTYGPEAIALMAAAGKPLDFWQQQSITLMLGTRHDSRWCCFEYCELCSRQNGKGGILEARALAGMFLLAEELIMWSAHEYKTAMEAFRRVRALVLNLGTQIGDNLVDVDGVPVKVTNTNGEEAFERLDTGQRIKFIARSKGSGRGFSGDVNIIDEAYAFTAEQQEALMPTALARPNPQFVYMSSPPLDAVSGEVLFGLKERAEAGEIGSLGYRDWGLAGDLDHLDRIDLDDQRLWAAANPALGSRLTLEKLAHMRRSMRANGGRGFARECLGLWPRRREQGGAIDLAQWAALGDPESKRAGHLALAVDIAPQRDYAAIGLYGVRADGVGHVQLVDYRPGTDWIVERLAELKRVLDPVAIGMGRGTGASLREDLAELGMTEPITAEAPARGDLAVLNHLDMSAACGQILDAVRQGTVRHTGQEPLDAAVAGAKVRETSDSIAWSRRDADSDISPLVAITAARWVFKARLPLLVDEDYDVLDSIG